MTYPYSDERMRYEETLGMYVLTPYALQERGFDINSRITAMGVQDPTQAATGFFLNVSDLIYEFIYSHNTDNKKQKRMIDEIPSMRDIIYRALVAQAIYTYANGDLSLSTKDEDEGKEISPRAKRELLRTIPEVGICILYTGVLPRWIFST